MKLVNLTPLELRLYIEIGVLSLGSVGVAYVAPVHTEVGKALGIPVVRATAGTVTGLPSPREGTLYIVDPKVRTSLPERTDLVSPGNPVRDEDGNLLGYETLIVN